MAANLHGYGTEDLLGEVLDNGAGPIYVVNPDDEVTEAVIEAATERAGDHAPVRLLADEDVIKRVFEDFIIASEASDIIAAEKLSIRTTGDLSRNTLLITDSSVFSIVRTDDTVGGLGTDDEAFVDSVRSAYERAWNDGTDYRLRTPPISQVRDSIDSDLGPNVRADFDGVLASLETARGDDDLDEVTVSLLVAAKNDVLLYDVSKWGEDVGIASKATFSRTKTRLEDRGIIDTEKVPIEVGRPRLRLKLADERLKQADPADLASVAQSVLAS